MTYLDEQNRNSKGDNMKNRMVEINVLSISTFQQMLLMTSIELMKTDVSTVQG